MSPVGATADSAGDGLQRSALLRSVTHGLRTPLAAIRAIVTDLHDGVDFDEETRAELFQSPSSSPTRTRTAASPPPSG